MVELSGGDGPFQHSFDNSVFIAPALLIVSLMGTLLLYYYLSQSSKPLYFGLGEADAVSRVEVTWPSGRTQTISEGVEMNSLLEIVEE